MRPKHRSCLPALALFTLLGSAELARSDHGNTIRFGYTTFDAASQLNANDDAEYSALIDYLEIVRQRVGDAPSFEISPGNYYQILRWMRAGELDAALVSPLLAALLAQDGVAIPAVELRLRSTPADGHAPRMAVFAGAETRVPGGEQHYRLHLDAVLRLATACKDLGSTACEQARAVSLEYRPDLVSHLSASGFLAPVLYARRWLDENLPKGSDTDSGSLRDRFWTHFFDSARFGLQHGCPGEASKHKQICFSYYKDGHEDWPGYQDADGFRIPHDVIVVRAEVLETLGPERVWLSDETTDFEATFAATIYEFPQRVHQSAHQELSDTLEAVLSRDSGDDALRRSFRRWFDDERFEFSVEEIVGFIRNDQANTSDPSLALVLPGGGVKSVYQAGILDELYASFLVNEDVARGDISTPSGSSTDNGEGPLVVDLVVGTSGGAIVGLYAASVESSTTKITEGGATRRVDGPITKRAVEAAKATVFPSYDLPRWVSLLLLLAVLVALVTLSRAAHHFCARAHETSNALGYDRLPRLRLIAVASLLALVAAMIYRARKAFEESGAVWEGMLFIATAVVLSYFCHPTGGIRRRSGRRGDPAAMAFLLTGAFFLGFSVIAVCLLPELADSYVQRELTPGSWAASFGGMTPVSWLASLGGLSLAIGVAMRWTHGPMPAKEARRFARGLAVVGGYLALAHIALFFLGRMETTAFFELRSLRFFSDVVIAGIIASAALILTSMVFSRGDAPDDGWSAAFHSAFSTSPPPTLTHPAASLLVVGLVATVAWSVLVAPALYGNHHARYAFETSLEDDLPLRTNLIVTGSLLDGLPCEGQQDRFADGDVYFCFGDEADCDKTTGGNWLPDEPLTERSTSHPFLRGAVFGSGSPFPIFPPHRVEVSPRCHARLVDGGYAHNSPFEAALRAGARQALVVHSAPADDASDNEPREWIVDVSALFDFGLRVIPYLFSRAQELDDEVKHELLVASLSPQGDFPWLADFRGSTIERMRQEAKTDLETERRLGTIESWGRPHVTRYLVSESTDAHEHEGGH